MQPAKKTTLSPRLLRQDVIGWPVFCLFQFHWSCFPPLLHTHRKNGATGFAQKRIKKKGETRVVIIQYYLALISRALLALGRVEQSDPRSTTINPPLLDAAQTRSSARHIHAKHVPRLSAVAVVTAVVLCRCGVHTWVAGGTKTADKKATQQKINEPSTYTRSILLETKRSMGAQEYDTRARYILVVSMPALASVIEGALSICRLQQTDRRAYRSPRFTQGVPPCSRQKLRRHDTHQLMPLNAARTKDYYFGVVYYCRYLANHCRSPALRANCRPH